MQLLPSGPVGHAFAQRHLLGDNLVDVLDLHARQQLVGRAQPMDDVALAGYEWWVKTPTYKDQP